MAASLKDKVYALVKKIPKGKVSTYGDLAAFAGHPRGAREVGWALNALPADTELPWWRVINSQGKISPRSGDDLGAIEHQATPLRKDKVSISKEGKIDLTKHRWKPRPTTIAEILSQMD
jgi:methylated-DNA-protein-cysteine methyltransferase-like protein